MTAREFIEVSGVLPEPMLLVSSEGRIVAANAAAGKACGRTASALAGRSLCEVVATPQRKLETFLRSCARTSSTVIGSIDMRSDGGQPVSRRCEGALVQPREGDRPALVLLRCHPAEVTTSRFLALNAKIEELAREVHERKRAEEALDRERNWFGAVLSSIGDAVIATDAAGRITFINAAACALTGWTAQDAAGQPLDAVFQVSDRATGPLLASKDGAARHVDHTIAPIRSGDGARDGTVLVFRDLTARRDQEEQLRQTQKLESLGLLAGGIAHDFNNLLTGILGNASLAIESLPPGNPARVFLDQVVRASQRAADLTRQMLAYAGRGETAMGPVDLSALISDIASLLQTTVPKNVALELDLDSDLPPVMADSGQVQQIVMNLVLNGAEAIPAGDPGYVRVRTRLETLDAPSIEKRFPGRRIPEGPYACIEVRDTGSGMDDSVRSRIFDPFFTTKVAGRGLGLASALGIIASHRGAIDVSSSAGLGSTFRVYLPASMQPLAPRLPASKGSELAGSETILIVDDEEVVRSTAKATLERYGYRALTAEHGQEGLEIFRRVPEISLIVLDMTMPVMGGEETLRLLHIARPEVPVLISSGFAEAEVMNRFNGQKLAGFLQKPFQPRELAEKVKAILEITKGADRTPAPLPFRYDLIA